jgi:WD40 repeat protein
MTGSLEERQSVAVVLVGVDLGLLDPNEAMALLDSGADAVSAQVLSRPDLAGLWRRRAHSVATGAPAPRIGFLAESETIAAPDATEAPAESSSSRPSDETLAREPPGRYVLLGELGRGGQSIVRVARDLFLGRDVAFKQLVGAGGEARFVHEARLTGRLEHPGIVSLHELGRRPDGTIYATQKLIRGETLSRRISHGKGLQDRLRLVRNFIDACYAVGYAHEMGVIHRDLKPENIMVGAFGETIVLDWGIARSGVPIPVGDRQARPERLDETQTGTILGTPGYMAPEQARGQLDRVGPAADVWSLGAILYEILAGTPAFDQPSSMARLFATVGGTVPPVSTRVPEAPRDLSAIAERAMAPDPKDRFRDAASLAAEVENWQAGRRIESYTYGTRELAIRLIRRNRAASALGMTLFVGAAVAAGLLFHERNLALAHLDRAVAAQARTAQVAALDQMRTGYWTSAAARFTEAERIKSQASTRLGQLLASGRALPTREVAIDNAKAILVTSPDGSHCAGESQDGRFQIWSCSTGESVASPATRVPTPVLAGFSFDGHRFAFVDSQDELSVLDAGKLVVHFPVGREQPAALALSPDGRQLAIVGKSGAVHLWDVDAGQRMAPQTIEAGLPDALFVAYSPSGKRLIIGTEHHGTAVLSADTGTLVATLADFRAITAVWLQAEDGAVLGDDFGHTELFDQEFQRRQAWERRPRMVRAGALAPGESWAVTGGGDEEIWFQETRSGTVFHRLRLSGPVIGLGLDPSRGTLTAITHHGQVVQVDTQKLSAQVPIAARSSEPSAAWCNAFSPDGSLVAVGRWDGSLQVIRTFDSLVNLDVLVAMEPDDVGCFSLVWAPDGSRLTIGAGHQILSWVPGEPAPRRWLATPASAGIVRCLAYSPSGRRLFVGLQDGTIQVRSTTDGALVAERKVHDGAISSVLAHGEDLVLSVGYDGHVVETESASLERVREVLVVDGKLRAAALSPNGSHIAVAGTDRRIDVVELESLERVSLEGHSDQVYALNFIPGTPWLASGSTDRTLRFWNVETHTPILKVDALEFGEIVTISVSTDGRQLTVGDTLGRISRLGLDGHLRESDGESPID